MAEAGGCLFELHRRVSNGLGGLARDVFSAGPSPRGAWVDHSIFVSLWGVLEEAVVHSWRLIGWNQLRENVSPVLATVMPAVVVESVRHCRQTTETSITHHAQPVVYGP